MRRQAFLRQEQRRQAEASARDGVARACRAVQHRGVPMAAVIRKLDLAERTARRWRRAPAASLAHRGRRPQGASREERNRVYCFLRQGGTSTSLAAVRAAFPAMRRDDLRDLVSRYRRVQRRKAQRHRSRLEWRRPGAVWAADFKERREPMEGRYGWILSIKDLASRYQLAWLPVEAADGEVVRVIYDRLFAEHGRPLVMKTDNGGPFRDDETKRLLAEYEVVPLFSPKRRPSYNGGVERANGQLAGYQEAVAEFRGRRAGPNREDAETARHLANDLARPQGWCGPNAGQLWAGRTPMADEERAAFRATIALGRKEIRAEWDFDAEAPLTHDQASAIDRRAVRDALVEHGLLRIHPRRRHPPAEIPSSSKPSVTALARAAILQAVMWADSRPHVAAEACPRHEEANSSTNKSSASGQN
jgi:transposase InsO family protein